MLSTSQKLEIALADKQALKEENAGLIKYIKQLEKQIENCQTPAQSDTEITWRFCPKCGCIFNKR